MTTRNAYIRVAAGIIIIALLYVAPLAIGAITAGERLSLCLAQETGEADIVIKLEFIPGPSELEFLQTFGRYGGSGGNLHNVILMNVPKANQRELSRMYWISGIAPMEDCVS